MTQSPVAPLPANEVQRLRTLHSYALLDTPPEAAFDRVTKLITRLFHVSMATVSLVDKDRQWFKSACGIDSRETPRDIAFCAHTILGEDMMVIPDASRDPRFAKNPLVTGPLQIRFYAGMPLKGFDGSNLGVLCAIDNKPRHFTETQKELLRELAEIVNTELRLRLETLEKNRLAMAVLHINTVVLITDPRQPGNPIVFCNPAFSKITGYHPSEVLGRTFGVLKGPGTNPAAYKALHQAVKERKPYRGTLLSYRKNGEPFWNDIHVNPVFDEHGQLINFVSLGHDITEHKESADTIRKSYNKLKKLEDLRDNLTHMIIHDLRAPLAVTMGFLDFVEQNAAARLNETEKTALKNAGHGARQINTMITSLLDVSRLESGKMPLEIGIFNLSEIAAKALAQEMALAGSGRLKLEVPAEPVNVRCDTALISRVINNLVSNALKFSPPDTLVEVHLTHEKGEAWLSVTDKGPGVPPEAHARIFEKFGQLKGKRDIHSSGLGLTFCKLAIKAQGGHIGLQSAPGVGSTFWFSIPLNDGSG